MFYAPGRSIAQCVLVLLTGLLFVFNPQTLAQSGGGVDQIGTGGRHSIAPDFELLHRKLQELSQEETGRTITSED